ncbi:Protein yceI precursor [Candidatus Sumerlaea chitinivorans]|jgi:polyisoprenoid-binding protein YceI|uniref:Protein yceI n=1 Tax=Sumerlaea chitinivorans TaxID=2250252 RepID=A0A2Z4Y8G0_SUMC1|nr:Protein yceI precursor [Candidatus Sumerlaea chitinivorans]
MKTRSILLTSLLSFAVLSTAIAAPESYTIDPVHSSITFSVRHLGVSSVKGRFTEFSGSIFYDEADVTQSSASVVIKAASINTDNPQRDEHLRGADFFDVEKYPEIRFRTTAIRKDGDKLTAVGFLVMHGNTKEIEIPFEIVGKTTDPWGKVRLGFEGHTTINRQDFGISYSKMLDNGSLVIGNDVKIELAIEATRNEPAGPPAKPAKEAKPAEANEKLTSEKSDN